jgi:hypothetical protein
VDRLLRRMLKAGLRRGMAERNWAWFVIAGCAFVLRRALSERGGVVSSLTISPGERVEISVWDHNGPVRGALAAATTVAAATADES